MYRILIVEDDRAIAQAVREQLEAWDMEARCVQNFRDVIGEFKAYAPHLVLMDIRLPFFNGYHWCSEIRRTAS
ncbi:MAG: response regulator, partial [Aristaeellaceae bacterium]